MPKITMICRSPEKSLTDKIQSYGTLEYADWFSFEQSIKELREKRDTDMLITGMPPYNHLYDRSCLLIQETFHDLQIPIIIYTTAEAKELKPLWFTPVFIVNRLGVDNWEDSLLEIVNGISKTWFPIDPEGRKQFMKILGADYDTAGSDFPSASDIMLYLRFGAWTPEKAQESLTSLNQSREIFGKTPIEKLQGKTL